MKVKSFTIFEEYYELITLLTEKKEKEQLSLAILEYMFENKKPTLNDRQMKIFINLKRPLDKSKNRSKSGTNKNQNENKKETKKEQKENKIETKKKQNENKTKTHKYVYVYVYVNVINNLNINNSNNKDNIYKLLEEYLQLRKKNKYTITETIVKRLVNKLNEYGKTDEEKIEVITNAINGAWKDFYPLKQSSKKTVEEEPWWYGKEVEEDKASSEEVAKLEEMLCRQ